MNKLLMFRLSSCNAMDPIVGSPGGYMSRTCSGTLRTRFGSIGTFAPCDKRNMSYSRNNALGQHMWGFAKEGGPSGHGPGPQKPFFVLADPVLAQAAQILTFIDRPWASTSSKSITRKIVTT